MDKSFNYNGEWFRPYRKLTQAERERPLSSIQDKLIRYSNEEFEKYWDLEEFCATAHSDADLYFWKGKVVMPSWNTFFVVNGWL